MYVSVVRNMGYIITATIDLCYVADLHNHVGLVCFVFVYTGTKLKNRFEFGGLKFSIVCIFHDVKMSS